MKKCYYVTTTGNVRKNNEDSFQINRFIGNNLKLKKGLKYLKKKSLVSVCDGMGGEQFGELASAIATKKMSDLNIKNINKEDVINEILDINKEICDEIIKKDVRIGSTIVCALIDKKKLTIFNLGDSRAYLFNNKKLIQLTKDHISSPTINNKKGLLTQHLGIFKEELEIEPFVIDNIKLSKGDYILLCSDGLYDMLSDNEICDILSMKVNSKKKREILLERALDNGGRDNITFLLIKC